MTHLDIIRAWKDPEYRLSLSEAERAQLPAYPAGLIELTDAELGTVAGGSDDSFDPNTNTDTDSAECETHLYYPTCELNCGQTQANYPSCEIVGETC